MSAQRPLRSVGALVAALVVGVLFSAGAQAAPGDLDPTFSGDGKQTTDFRFGSSDAAATVRQPDGKIVAVGTRPGVPRLDFASPATTPTARLDTSFSGDGKQMTDFGARGRGDRGGAPGRRQDRRGRHACDSPRAPRRLRPRPLQPQRHPRHELLRRRQADNRLRLASKRRTAWRSRRTARSSPWAAHAAAAATLPSPATTPTARSTRASLATASRPPTSAVPTTANGVAIQATARSSSVGRGGRRQRRLRPRPLQPQRLARHELLWRTASRRPTSAIHEFAKGWRSRPTARSSRLASRRGRPPRSGDFALVRYNTNGSLDPSFSGDGKQTTDFAGGFDATATGVALQADGKIVAVGSATRRRRLRARPLQPDGLARHDLLRRRQADDRLRGRAIEANGVALQADGKIVVVGADGGGPGSDFALARYNPNGSLDTSFSGDGKQTTDFAGFDRGDRGGHPGGRQDRRGRRSPVTTDLAATTSRSPATTRTAPSTRASPATASRRPTSGASTQATGVALQADGKIVVVGSGRSRPADFALARYNPNGTLDTSFSGDGKQTTDFGGARRGDRCGAPGERQDRRGRREADRRWWRLRARPLQPQRLARHELLRRRQADDRLRGPRRGDTGWRSRPTARSSRSASGALPAPTSRSPATTPTARSTRASPATASRRPTSRRQRRGKRGGAPGRTARSSRSGMARSAARLRARPLQPERHPRHELLRRRQADDRLRRASTRRRGGAPG